jgi:two-component system, chemotaxis family, chemotaxis protein CheY
MKSISVLIVDDSSVMRKIVERAVRQSGLTLKKVLEAENGEIALKLLQTESPDLVFSDINMPTMDGIEFLRHLREAGTASSVPILMITTEGGEAKVMEAISLGARGYIRKPFTPADVRQQISEALQVG